MKDKPTRGQMIDARIKFRIVEFPSKGAKLKCVYHGLHPLVAMGKNGGAMCSKCKDETVSQALTSQLESLREEMPKEKLNPKDSNTTHSEFAHTAGFNQALDQISSLIEKKINKLKGGEER